MLLAVVSAITVSLVVDTIEVQGFGGGPRNYELARSTFVVGSPYVLELQLRGSPVTHVTEWYVLGLPPGVTSASINRHNGQDVLEFTGLAPQPVHTFNVVAVVMEANREIASVQFVVSIHTA